ncbi:MAG TPA: hypothetical protein PKM73_16755 [Verrucomicrobiota bacterium]|nr:hypothetical protein [Verrucomicrobiota bacterium]HNU49420.1 hypothetical protein [Verrucomicrobiota bacterium]
MTLNTNLAVGAVILGVGGKPFSCDPRTEFGAWYFDLARRWDGPFLRPRDDPCDRSLDGLPATDPSQIA